MRNLLKSHRFFCQNYIISKNNFGVKIWGGLEKKTTNITKKQRGGSVSALFFSF